MNLTNEHDARRERNLDDAIADSFPASDPVSLSQPHNPEKLGVRRHSPSMTQALLVGGGLLAILAIIAFRR